MNRLTAELSANSNKIIGFSFDLGSLNSAEYGSASNLKGKLLYTLPCQYKIPKTVENPTILHQIAIETFPICRDIFTELLDEEAIAKMEDYALIGSMLIASEMDLEKSKCVTLILTLGAASDDMTDNVDNDSLLPSYKLFTESFNNGLENLDGFSLKSFPNLTYEIVVFKSAIKATAKFAKKCWPNWQTKAASSNVLINEIKFNVQTTLVSKMQREDADFTLSKTTMNEIFRGVTGNVLMFEIFNFLFDIDIPTYIRQDILFKTAQNNFVDMLQLINAFIGLERDLKNNQEDNPLMYLVTVSKMSIQEAFDECYENYQDAYSDYMINVTKLLEVYGDDDNVCKYLHHLSWFLDGSLTAYSLVKRYKGQQIMQPIYTDKN